MVTNTLLLKWNLLLEERELHLANKIFELQTTLSKHEATLDEHRQKIREQQLILECLVSALILCVLVFMAGLTVILVRHQE